ncbi:MAG: thymidine phosphorylase [Pyrinomonadaceae bacterium]|nr:thymidine phosphorylase [Pyrinomonadaceae bacterium]
MNLQEIIRKKRDGETLSQLEINDFVRGVTDESWADYQISAFIMASYIRGINMKETGYLTEAMLHSGEVLDFSEIDAPKADKHSTGGVGDKTSLIIAPIVAACGVAVPMISGRGLGHTGGTLDKLEAIKGYNVNLSLKDFRKTIKKCGFAMTGQTKEIAPADKKIYAIRDATATVDCIGLIVASIMSKKLAEGLDALILDVKTGNGAFMKSAEDAQKLAKALCKIGKSFNVNMKAVISDMNQPLGKFVGNAVEVFECIKIMRNEADPQMLQTLELSIELAAQILISTKIAENPDDAKSKIQSVLKSGATLQKFKENIELQNGDAKICDKPEMLIDNNLLQIEVKSAFSGFVNEINSKVIGESVFQIGGGRRKIDDKIDYAVGFHCEAKIGDEVKIGETLGVLYCRKQNDFDFVGENLRNAYKIGDEKPAKLDLIKQIFD